MSNVIICNEKHWKMTKSCQVRGAEQVTDLELEQFLGTKET